MATGTVIEYMDDIEDLKNDLEAAEASGVPALTPEQISGNDYRIIVTEQAT